MRTRALLTLPFLAVFLATFPMTGQAQAADPAKEAQRQFELGTEMILDGLRMLIERIPQFSAPEILPNGDIIIRRRNPQTPPRSDDDDKDDTDQDIKKL